MTTAAQHCLPPTAPIAGPSPGRGHGEHADLSRQLAVHDDERVALHYVPANTPALGIGAHASGKRAMSLNAARTALVKPVPYLATSARTRRAQRRRAESAWSSLRAD